MGTHTPRGSISANAHVADSVGVSSVPFHPENQHAFNSLTQSRIDKFGELAPYMKRNPRKAKRIVNVYRLCLRVRV